MQKIAFAMWKKVCRLWHELCRKMDADYGMGYAEKSIQIMACDMQNKVCGSRHELCRIKYGGYCLDQFVQIL